jgi:hypothetical protein
MRRRTMLTVEPLEYRALLSGLTESLTTNQTVYQAGQPIQMTLTFTNNGNEPAQIGVGPSVDGFIATQNGETVWQSNSGINPLVIVLETVQPGASYTLHATWDGTIANGSTATTTTGQFVLTNQLDPQGTPATFTIESPLSYSVSTPQPDVAFGRPVDFSYAVTNISDQPVTFNMAPADFIVTIASNGDAAWESDPAASSQGPTSETLQPGQSVTQTASWNGVANEGAFAGTNVWEQFYVALADAPIAATEEFQIASPLSQSVSTDQPTYQPGQPVQLTATETNVSDEPITILNTNDVFNVVGPGGGSLPAVNVSSTNPIVTLQPGQSQTFTATWDQQSDGTGTVTVPGGNYRVFFQDYFQGEAFANFLITTSSSNPVLPPGGPSANPPQSSGSSSTNPPSTSGGDAGNPPLTSGSSTTNPSPSTGSSSSNLDPSTVAVVVTTNHTTNPHRNPLRINIAIKKAVAASAESSANPNVAKISVREGSTVVWTKSLLTPKAKSLKPGQTLRLSALWNGKPNVAGVKSLPPGLYTVEVDDGRSSASTEIRIG